MIDQALLVGLVALGHACLLIAVINWAHGRGLYLKHHDQIVGSLLVAIGLASLAGTIALFRSPWRAWAPLVWLYAGPCLMVSCVALPAITLARGLRRRPTDLLGRRARVVLTSRVDREVMIGTLSRGTVLRWPGNQAFQLDVFEWSLPIPGLAPALDGLRLLHLSDFHFTRAFDRRYFDEIARETERLDSDITLFTGDLLDDDGCQDWVGPVFDRLRGLQGSYAILGNHDLHHGPKRLSGSLEAAGFRVLDGTWSVLDCARGGRLAVAGTFAPWGPLPDPSAAPAADFRLVLSHTPDLIYQISRWGADLVLSGHNHGGQVRLPLVGPVLMPSRYGRRFDRGFFRVGSTWLHVSQGIGAKWPYRLNCAPEITGLTLRAVALDHVASAASWRRPSSRIRSSGQTSRK